MDPEKVRVVQQWPKPSNLTELCVFLGLVKFFQSFITCFNDIAAPLKDLTWKDMYLSRWDDGSTKAFTTLKEALTTSSILITSD